MERRKLSREEVEEIVMMARLKGERPDLSRVDLSEVDLSGANLHKANLHKANLSEANLSEADLREANLSEANLSEANLSAADLIVANLRAANLRAANLSAASLFDANLGWTNLHKADLTEAGLGGTIFTDTNMAEVKGLETVRHATSSYIDTYTLLNPDHNLPEIFLRGAGVPEALITYLPSILNEPIQFYSCFISYSAKDTPFAKRLHADLQQKGIRCWYAPEDMKIGDKLRPRIDESIRMHEKLLLILSENSLASDWVEHEVESALEQEKDRKEPVLFPVRLDDAVMKSKEGWAALIKRSRHIGDFREWEGHAAYQKAFERLLRDLTVERNPATGG